MRALLLLLLTLLSGASHASSKLEIGGGVFFADIPHYLGSEQSEQYSVPTPYIRYTSDELDIDRSGLTGYLWQNGRLHLDISAGVSLAVANEENQARQGMDDLDWGLELGPSLNYYLAGDSKTIQQLYFSLFTRKAIATDFSSLTDTGWRYGVSVYGQMPVDFMALSSPLILSVKANVNFATRRYHDYFYTVAAQFSRADRPTYTANAGYSGTDLSLGLSYDSEQYWLGGFVKYHNIANSVYIDSPLIKQHHNLSAGFGFAWKFYQQQGK